MSFVPVVHFAHNVVQGKVMRKCRTKKKSRGACQIVLLDVDVISAALILKRETTRGEHGACPEAAPGISPVGR